MQVALRELKYRSMHAAVVLCTLLAASCGEDLGPCDDKLEGREPVLLAGKVQFGGQAIINKACATGCHSSSASGAARHGAPAGLDFDIQPIGEDDAKGVRENRDGDPVLRLTNTQLERLRAGQKRILEYREDIWQQVRDGLMPPGGAFESFRKLSSLFATTSASPCNKGKKYGSLSDAASQQVLRTWLACGAPMVESTGTAVEKAQSSGSAGWQYASCETNDSGDAEGSADGSGQAVSLASLLEGPLSTCSSCHPGISKPSFQSVDAVQQEVVDSEEVVCDGKPYVSKGKPEESYLYDILALKEPGCGHKRMPSGGPYLSKGDLDAVAAWITAGAPLTDADLVGMDEQAPSPDDLSASPPALDE